MTLPQKKLLSHNSFDAVALAKVLQQFDGKSHEEILDAFEARLCEITHSPFAVALSSGTAALHLGLQILGVQKNDDVAVSTFTYVGSVNPIRYLEARPVFIDSEKKTWNMDPNLLEDYLKKASAQGKLPGAIEIVHTYGMPARMNDILSMASHFEVPVIEDAAAGLGGNWHGNALGSMGEIGVISFNNNKTVTTFGGGALLTKSKKIYDKAKFLATQAREKKPYYEFREVGYNYRMGPLNALYGLSQLALTDEKIKTRRKIHDDYVKGLKDVSKVSFLKEPENYFSSRWLTTILLDTDKQPVTKEQLHDELEKNNVESRYLWKPMHKQPVFSEFQYYGSDFSEQLFERGLCLPTSQELSPDRQEEIVAIIKTLMQK